MRRADFEDMERLFPRTKPDSVIVYIYALLDPETGEARYIGKSVRPAERLRNHMNEPPSNCHRSHWIQSLRSRGLEPDMVVLERIEGEWPWQESERFWISYGRANGWRLTNNTDGGDGVPGLPKEAAEKISAAWRGKKHSPETLEKLRVARARRPKHSDETRAKMSAAQTGRIITWGDKLSEANRKLSQEQQADIVRRLSLGEKTCALAREYGVHRTTLSKVKMGRYRG